MTRNIKIIRIEVISHSLLFIYLCPLFLKDRKDIVFCVIIYLKTSPGSMINENFPAKTPAVELYDAKVTDWLDNHMYDIQLFSDWLDNHMYDIQHKSPSPLIG